MTVQATVIVPTFEDWGALQACLDCLAAQTADPGLYEVIVANNNRTSALPGFLRLPANARVIHVERPGSYAARNAAIAEARGDILFFTDSDCLPDSRWIEAGLAAISPLGPLGRVAGGVEMFQNGHHWTVAELYDRVHQMRQPDYFRSGWCVTANLVTRRATFDHVGLFDPERFSGGDLEWGERATAMGSELVFRPDVLIRHPARASFAELARKRRRTVGGRQHEELTGRAPKRTILKSLSFLSVAEIYRTMAHPGLTESQRLKIMGVCFCLGVIGFTETVRLRYLSGRPHRS